MPALSAFRAIFTLSYAALALAAAYSQTDNISGSGFLSAFNYEAIADPTHGRVYVNQRPTTA